MYTSDLNMVENKWCLQCCCVFSFAMMLCIIFCNSIRMVWHTTYHHRVLCCSVLFCARQVPYQTHTSTQMDRCVLLLMMVPTTITTATTTAAAVNIWPIFKAMAPITFTRFCSLAITVSPWIHVLLYCKLVIQHVTWQQIPTSGLVALECDTFC